MTYQKAAPQQLQRVKEQWPSIVEPLMKESRLFACSMRKGSLRFDVTGKEEDVLYVVLDGVLDNDSASEREKIIQIENNIEDLIGSRIRVRVVEASKADADHVLREIETEKKLKKHINFPIDMVSDQEG